MKIVENKIDFKIDFLCKCGYSRFIKKEIYPTYIELLCIDCEKKYTMKIFTEEIE